MKRESSTIAAWRTNLALRWRYLLALSITMLPFACASAAGWDYHTGKGYTLCDALHKRLNQYSYPNPKRPNSCAWNVALTYPEFKEPDWTELDPKQHSELAYRLIRYGQSSGSKVFSAYRESLIRDEVQKFIERGGRVQLWRTDLISDFFNKNHPERWTPPGLQNVIQLREPPRPVDDESTGRCPSVPLAQWGGGRIFIVNDDLTDIHQDIGSAAFYLAMQSLVLYQGRPYFLSGAYSGQMNFSLTLGWDTGGGPGDFCQLDYTHTPSRRK